MQSQAPPASSTPLLPPPQLLQTQRCCGYPLPSIFPLPASAPANSTVHTLYPFGLHSKLALPWSYTVINNVMTFYANACTGEVKGNARGGAAPALLSCALCRSLKDNGTLAGIILRMTKGVHPNTPLDYHGIGGLTELVRRKALDNDHLRLCAINQTRKLLVLVGELSEYKRLVAAVANGE